MRIVAEIERDRGLVAQYDENQSYYRTRIRTTDTSWVGWTSGWEVRRDHES